MLSCTIKLKVKLIIKVNLWMVKWVVEPHPGGERPQSKKDFFSDDTDCCTDKEIESNSLWGC